MKASTDTGSMKTEIWRPRRTPAYCTMFLKFKHFCFWDFKKYPLKIKAIL